MKTIAMLLIIVATLYIHMESQTDEVKDKWVHSVTDNLIP